MKFFCCKYISHTLNKCSVLRCALAADLDLALLHHVELLQTQRVFWIVDGADHV